MAIPHKLKTLLTDPLLLLLAAGIAARWFLLGSGSLTIDEIGTLVIARQPLPDLIPYTLHLGFNPPLFNFFTSLWQSLGEGALWLRALPFIFSAAALAAYRSFCKEFFSADPESGAAAARLAVFLGAFSPFWINLGQQFRMYSLFLFLAILANHLFLKLLRGTAAPRHRAAYGVVLLLGLYTHYYFGFVWAAQGLTTLVFVKEGRGRLVLTQIGAMLVFLPWLAAGIKAVGVVSGVQSMDWSSPFTFLGNFLLGWGTVDMLIPRWLAAAGVLGFCAAAAGLWRLKTRRAELLLALLHIALPLLSVPVLELLTGNSFSMPRYWLFITPFYYLLLAYAAEGLAGWRRSTARILLAAAVVGGLCAYYVLKIKVDPFFLPAARRIEQVTRPGTLVLHTSAYWYMPLKYYYAPGFRHCIIASPGEENGFLATGWLPDHCVIGSLKDPQLAAEPFLLVDPYRKATGQLLSPASRRLLGEAKLMP
ncbi:MAG: hypothetical protein A2X31_00650 [Elusimicrobia bacterium GWB2_63_22]|nr:MAG: hypothetical protein A2X31_00650 [Elusimicrobia bacterium GWB2_63_22]